MLPNGTPVALTSGIHSILNNGNNAANNLNNSSNLSTINSACSLLSSNTFSLQQNSSLLQHQSGSQIKLDESLIAAGGNGNNSHFSNNNNINLSGGLSNSSGSSNANSSSNHHANSNLTVNPNTLLNNAVMCAGGIGNLSRLSVIRHWIQPHTPSLALDIPPSSRLFFSVIFFIYFTIKFSFHG